MPLSTSTLYSPTQAIVSLICKAISRVSSLSLSGTLALYVESWVATLAGGGVRNAKRSVVSSAEEIASLPGSSYGLEATAVASFSSYRCGVESGTGVDDELFDCLAIFAAAKALSCPSSCQCRVGIISVFPSSPLVCEKASVALRLRAMSISRPKCIGNVRKRKDRNSRFGCFRRNLCT